MPPTLHPLPLDLGPQLQFMAWQLPNDGNDGMVARAATGHCVRPGGDNAHPLVVGSVGSSDAMVARPLFANGLEIM